MNDFNTRKYWEERLTENCGLLGVGYLGLGKCFNSWLYRIRSKIFRRLIKYIELDFNSASVLDIGSGTGFYIDEWKKQGVAEVAGIDITDVAVDNLRKKYPDIEFKRMDIGESFIAEPEHKYDIISAFDVLFHIVDDARYEQAIINIGSLLRDDGYFLISDNFLHKETLRAPHQVCHTLSTISSMLDRAGFTIIRRVPMFILMNYPCDTDSRALDFFWRKLSTLVTKGEFFGFITGGILYPLEMMLTAVLKESPTTEIMICRKRI